MFRVGLTPFDYAIVVAYMAGMVAIGFYFSRRQKDSESYFLAGRSFGWFPIAVSIVATLVSTTSFLSFPSETYQYDIRIWSYIFVTPLGLLVITRVFIPFYQRLQVTSTYEFLERRFNLPMRVLTSALFVLMRITWMSVAVHSASLAVCSMADLPLVPVIFGIGLITVLYTTLGGMEAVIWTDVVQFFIFFGALVLTFFYIGWQLPGGLGEMLTVCSQHGKFAFFNREYFVPDPTVRITFWSISLNTFVWILATYGADQLVVQRYQSTRNQREATGSIWGNFLFGDVLLTFFQIGVGLALFAFYSRFRNLLPAGMAADKVFPYFIAHGLPTGISGLILAAMFAAIMSSISSGVNSIAAVLTVDFYRRFSRVKPTERSELRFARLLTPAMGVLVSVLAASLVGGAGNSILERAGRAGGFLIGPVLGIFILAIFFRRANAQGTMCGVAIGLLAGLAVAFGHRWGWFPELSFQLPAPASFGATVMFGALASRLWARPARAELEGLVYGSVR